MNAENQIMFVGAFFVVVGAIGGYSSSALLQPTMNEIARLKEQQTQQIASLISLNSEVNKYWQGLTDGRAAAGTDARTYAEQIKDYCLTTRIFRETTLHQDNGLCAKVEEASAMASQLETTGEKLAAELEYADKGILEYLKVLSGFFALNGTVVLLCGLAFRKVQNAARS